MEIENDNDVNDIVSTNNEHKQVESRAEPMDTSNDIDLNSQYAQLQLAELDAMKPARSGYMLFAKSNRKQVGQCGAVSEQSKRIAALWNALGDEERKEWNNKVADAKRKYEEFLDNNPEKKKLLLLQQENKRLNKSKTAISFPLGTIKKIVLKDPDIKRISKESLVLITQSTQLFIDELVKKINEQQTAKTLTENDFINTLHSNSKYMFIRHVFKKNKNSVLGVNRKKKIIIDHPRKKQNIMQK
eukprot:UN00759